MRIIQKITSDAAQKQTLTLPDGNQVIVSFYFSSMQFGWFIESLQYNDFIAKGLRICITPNLLYQFKNQIPFGIACFSNNNREPMLIEDFSSGNCSLYILSQEEVEEYSEYLSG